ncbi:MAG: hypothetical protein LUH05_04885 [Candidatus Gastranaerophilales bacterium]|nr:hypothetical protein [Candidatus Gastranaerophilales bacterium]
MDKERKLYDKFVDKLNDLLDSEEITSKELNVILNFLKDNDIKAQSDVHQGLVNLKAKLSDLPFDVDELPIERLN